MLQTNFLRPHMIEFVKAAGGTGAVLDMKTISIELHSNGVIWLDGEATDIESLRSYAAGISSPGNARIILGVDPDVMLQRAVDVMDLFNQYGLFDIALIAARKFD
jgi:biopolymer transport protein ExbD